MDAYKLVKMNAGSAGVDQQSIADFEVKMKDNLYKLWNRMSSGSYFPPPVKAVPIPKKTGGERILGVPTVSDRIAQMIIKVMFEPKVEPYFHRDSYGYRPNKSALDAIEITRKRCWQYNWCLEFDIKGLFDNISHQLLMKAVRKHTDDKLSLLYIERWLKAPMQMPDGDLIERTKGTPQGGVISPILSNLFLHYVFDSWMCREYNKVKWCRYADDALIHCKTEQRAQLLLINLESRFKKCGLELHPMKTKIIYCKDVNRKKSYPETQFDFLGFTFKPREVLNSKDNKIFTTFSPAASDKAIKAMRAKTKEQNFGRRVELNIEDIARLYNPVINGWINYYGHYNRSSLDKVFRHFNKTLIRWAMRKYIKLTTKTKATKFILQVNKDKPKLFAHWNIGIIGSVA